MSEDNTYQKTASDVSRALDGLNPEQRDAVLTTEGPMLILAGAGSGKTKVLTCRIAHLLDQGQSPFRILAITFTNKAAKEMRARVDKLVGTGARRVWLHTFHAFCARVLQQDVEALGVYRRNFTIYDTGDQLTLIKNILKDFNLDDKRFKPSAVLGTISRAKNALLDADGYGKQAEGFNERKVAEIYTEYARRLLQNNAMDFDDLLLVTIHMLEKCPDVREKYRRQFDYILVDEYQDTNRAQYLLTKLLVDARHNLCVVGDADQSIYGWRGADIRNILDFEKDYPEAKIVKLEQNYRSTGVILEAANAVIENNTERKPKELWTKKSAGKPIVYYLAEDERDEARFALEQIADLRRNHNLNYGDFAVLYRTNTQSRVFEEILIKAGISYSMVGGIKFYDRQEVRDIMAYLKLLHDPADELSLRRVINVPRRGIGQTTLVRLQDYARKSEQTLFEVVTNAGSVPGIAARTAAALDKFSELIFGLMDEADRVTVAELINSVIQKSGYKAELELEHTAQAQNRLENLTELGSVAQDFMRNEEEATLARFLEHVSLVSDIDDAKLDNDKVTLMTLHAAKGLEFPVVFLAGMEEGLFPHARTLLNESEIEEERRLCYVGITRAERFLYLTGARLRMIYGRTAPTKPSRFLQEIPRNLLREYKRPSLYAEKIFERRSARQDEQARYRLDNTNLRKMFAPAAGKTETFAPGDRVTHKKWGVGTIVEVKASQDGQEVKVAFAGEGVRSLLTKYAVLKKL